MAENGQRADGISLTGLAFDKELYGGGDAGNYENSIGVAEEDELDEREQSVRRCAPLLRRLHCVAAFHSFGYPNPVFFVLQPDAIHSTKVGYQQRSSGRW